MHMESQKLHSSYLVITLLPSSDLAVMQSKKKWVRKDSSRIQRERVVRKTIGRVLGVILVAICAYYILENLGLLLSDRELLKLFSTSLLVGIPLFIIMYRSYVYFGNPVAWAPSRRCLHCNKVSHRSNGPNGFMAFKSMESRREEISGCKEPGLCDIAMNFEIRKVNK